MLTVALSTPGELVSEHRDGFERARLALHLAGIESGTTDSWHAYRSYDAQVALFKKNYDNTPRAGRTIANLGRRWWDGRWWYRKDGCPVTARPGTSNHGDGDTVDWQGLGGYDSATWKKASPILKGHGWNNVEGAKIGEPWHWTRVSANDKHKGEVTLTVSEYKNIMAKLDELAAGQSALKAEVEQSTSYKESGLATSVVEAADAIDANLTAKVDHKFVPVYVQAVLYGMRHVIGLLERIVTKIGA